MRTYTRHTSSCWCVGYIRSPESLTSSGFTRLPPSCNSNILGTTSFYKYTRCQRVIHKTLAEHPPFTFSVKSECSLLGMNQLFRQHSLTTQTG
ncbi:hypothetical protein C1O30_10825 [Dickeya zeae]|nr:hypothetical protein C1O30_10825 [Dickeya zeae]